MYFSIGEVASKFKVSTSLIRYWEKEFDILKPKKNHKGTRSFTQKDIDNFQLIYRLLKEKGFTIEGAKKHIASSKEEANKIKTIRSLKKIRTFLTEIKDNL